MKKRNLILNTIAFLAHLAVFAQCIERKKISYGSEYGFVDFIHLCPTYNFSYDGDKSTDWNLLSDPIDIRQAPKEVLIFKEQIENEIRNYSGNDLYSKLVFKSVEVVYEDKLGAFIERGRQNLTLEYCKAKYFYYYELELDNISTYLIGVTLDKKGKRISDYHFPNKSNYVPIDTNYDYCKLIEIAKKSQPQIEPIRDIKLDYDEESKSFFWQITQEIVNIKEGKNNFNQVIIDASDLNKTKNIVGETYINF
jgi:hypothetical protein